jgi:high affinity Mn2+ porin
MSWRPNRSYLAAVLAGTLLCPWTARGADAPANFPVKAPIQEQSVNWFGLYAGAHGGYGRGTADTLAVTPASNTFGSLFAGVQVGYNFALSSKLLFGVEGDVSFANFYLDDQIATRITPAGEVSDQIDFIARLRARL